MQLHWCRGEDVLDLLLHLPHVEGLAAVVTGQCVTAVGLCVLWPVGAALLEASLPTQVTAGRRRVVIQAQAAA